MSLYVFDLDRNAAAKVGERSYGDVSGTAWHGGKVVISAAEQDDLPYQLRAINYPSGEAARLTNDFSSYFDISITRDSTALVTAKREKSSAVWLINLDLPNSGKQLTAGNDRLDGVKGVSWTADDQILYIAGVGSQYSLMSMNHNGANNRVLDVNVVRPSSPSLTGDKRYVVFADSKDNKFNRLTLRHDQRRARPINPELRRRADADPGQSFRGLFDEQRRPKIIRA